jgi:hypothetical protein
MRCRLALAAGTALVLLTGCAGSSESAQPSPQPSPSASPAAVHALPTCQPAAATKYAWPQPVPADLPKLPGAALGETKRTADGLTIVRFSTRTSLREGVLFIVRNLPPAGYVLGRGDAEATEADAPFSKGVLRGVLRGISREVCATEWLLAVTRTKPGAGTGNPLLPMRQGASPSPLPFG